MVLSAVKVFSAEQDFYDNGQGLSRGNFIKGEFDRQVKSA